MDPISAAGGQNLRPISQMLRSGGKPSEVGEGEAKGASFGDSLANSLNEISDLQKKADASIEKVATGEAQSLHEVMIAFEQARLSMQMLVEVRNKFVEAYQEVSRMPI